VTAALVRLLTHRVELHGASGLVGWVTPVIAVTAVAGLLLEQGAYKSGHLGVAVAGYTVTDPLVAVTLGALVLHQPARASHPLWAAGEALVVMTGVVLLARATNAPRPDPAAAHEAGGYRQDAERGRVRADRRDGAGRECTEPRPRVEAQVPRDGDGGPCWFPGGDEGLGERKVLQAAVRGSG